LREDKKAFLLVQKIFLTNEKQKQTSDEIISQIMALIFVIDEHMSGKIFGSTLNLPNNIGIRYINPWKKCNNLMQFLKYLAEPFSRSLRSPRSKDLETKNDGKF
jgi:hypothetical protein